MQQKTSMMYQIWTIAFIALSINVTFLWSSNAEAQVQPLERYEISFSKSKSVEDVVSTARKNHVEILALQDTFMVGGVPTTDFYFVQDTQLTSSQINNDYRIARQGMLNDMRGDLKKMGPPPGARTRSLLEMTASPDGSRIDVESVEVMGNTVDVIALADALRGTTKSRLKDQMGKTLPTPTVRGGASGLVTTAAPAVSTWAPKQGWLYTGISSTAGNRYATNYIWWNDVSGLRENSLTTYEHELLLNNYDGRTYFDSSENIYKQPKITYSSSNLPSPYLDTRASDNRSELSYTIGSGAGANIQANTSYWYNTYFRILPGNTSNDTGKVNAQLGRKDPSCIVIPFAYCVFAMATVNLVSAWTAPVPGTLNWVRN